MLWPITLWILPLFLRWLIGIPWKSLICEDVQGSGDRHRELRSAWAARSVPSVADAERPRRRACLVHTHIIFHTHFPPACFSNSRRASLRSGEPYLSLKKLSSQKVVFSKSCTIHFFNAPLKKSPFPLSPIQKVALPFKKLAYQLFEWSDHIGSQKVVKKVLNLFNEPFYLLSQLSIQKVIVKYLNFEWFIVKGVKAKRYRVCEKS